MADARVLVIGFINAYYRGDPIAARAALADDLSFEGPSATLSGADDFLRTLAHVAPSVEHVEILKAVVDGDDVLVFYELHLNDGVQTIPIAQWSVVHNDKIARIRLIFDTGAFRS